MKNVCIITIFIHPENGGSMNLWNVGILPQHCMASQPRRPQLETSPVWKPQNSHQWRGYSEYGNSQDSHTWSTISVHDIQMKLLHYQCAVCWITDLYPLISLATQSTTHPTDS